MLKFTRYTRLGLALLAVIAVSPMAQAQSCFVATQAGGTTTDGCATVVDGGVAAGQGATASNGSVAVGAAASADVGAVAVGESATATNGGVAVGIHADASGVGNVAIGDSASATGQFGTAIGNSSTATGNGTAIGSQASAVDNSVAIGANSVADREGTVSVGSAGQERQITNVAAGTADTDAVNVAQMRDGDTVTLNQANSYTDVRSTATLNQANAYTDVQSSWTLNQANAYTDVRFDQLNVQLGDINSRIDGLDLRLDRIAAMNGAMGLMAAAAAANPAGSKVSMAVAGYGSTMGLAAGYQTSWKLKSGRPAAITWGGAWADGEVTAGVGLSFGVR